jgi:hypothetical protein
MLSGLMIDVPGPFLPRTYSFELYSQFLSYKHHVDATFVPWHCAIDNDRIVADSHIAFAINANAGL